MGRWGFALLLLWSLATPLRAHADNEPPELNSWDSACVDQLDDAQVTEQLGFVMRSLAHQRLPATLWWSTWNAFNLFNVAFGAYRFTVEDDRLKRDSWLVSFLGAAIFVADVSILPLPGMYAARRLRGAPEGTAGERRAKLKRAFHLLNQAARIEDANSDWIAHVLGVAYATASTAYVWIRNRDVHAAPLALALSLQLVTSIGVAELTFWTVPRKARRDRNDLRERVCAPALGHVIAQRAPEPSRASLSLALSLGQVGFVGRF